MVQRSDQPKIENIAHYKLNLNQKSDFKSSFLNQSPAFITAPFFIL